MHAEHHLRLWKKEGQGQQETPPAQPSAEGARPQTGWAEEIHPVVSGLKGFPDLQGEALDPSTPGNVVADQKNSQRPDSTSSSSCS
jgi:hypothetical protein